MYGRWGCVKQCGACCYLGTDQPDLEFLQDEDMRLQYKAMVGNVRANPTSGQREKKTSKRFKVFYLNSTAVIWP